MRFRKAAVALFALAATTAFAGNPDSNTVQKAQQALNDKGFEAGSADGKWGPNTQAAVQKFQQSKNLNQSGQLDAQTLAALDIQAQADSGFGPRPDAAQSQGTNASQPQGTNASQSRGTNAPMSQGNNAAPSQAQGTNSAQSPSSGTNSAPTSQAQQQR